MQKYAYTLLASLAFVGGAYWYGVSVGTEKEKVRQEKARQVTQKELDNLSEVIATQALGLERLKSERLSLVQKLENEAISAPSGKCPGVAATGGLRRLEQRWGQP